jgi:putative colanic acid biosynthesis glycosyltransferase
MSDKGIIISIVTVSLNNKDGLIETIRSIRYQVYKNYELIIIDGNSTDGTVEIIEKNKDIIYYSISESDNGLYDAMNKGLGKATGDFVLFLNTGDVFYDDDVLMDVINTITVLDTVYFGCAKILKDRDLSYIYPQLHSTKSGIINFLKYRKPNHQAMFFPRKFYMTARYDLQYKIAGDEDYKIRAIKACGYIFIDKIIVSFVLGGISFPHSFTKVKQQVNELARIHQINNIYSIRNHIRISVTLSLKYLFNALFGTKSYKMLILYSNIKKTGRYVNDSKTFS